MTRSRSSIGPVRNPQTHEAILAAAEEVLQEYGYGGFTLDLVARRAKASKPTLYKWWKTKAGLITELYGRQSAQLLPVPDLGSLHKELLFFCSDLWRLWRETTYGEALRSLIAEAQQTPATRDFLRNELMPMRKQLARALFLRAIDRGEIAADVDIEAALVLIMGFHWYRLLIDDMPDEDDLLRMVTMVDNALTHLPKLE